MYKKEKEKENCNNSVKHIKLKNKIVKLNLEINKSAG